MSIAARLVILLCTVLAALGGGWRAYHKGDATGYARAQGEHAAEDLRASERARKREADLNAANDKVKHDLLQTQRAHAAAVAAADDAERLFLAALNDAAPSSPGATATARIDGTGGPERNLLGACATTVVGLAKEADRLEDKVVMLQDYVRTVCAAPAAAPRPP